MTINSRYGGRRLYEDQRFPCLECGTWFTLTVADQKYYDERGFKWPKRCLPCRQARRNASR